MNEFALQITRIGGLAVATAAALGMQRLLPHDRQYRSRWANVGLWLVNGALLSAICGTCACTVARWAAATGVGVLNLSKAPPWIALPTTIAVLDLVSYGWHRANHRVPLLWRFHQVHHSDTQFTVSTGVRFHPGELLLSLPVRLLAVALLGAPAGGVVLFEIVFTAANLFEHGNIQLPLGLERQLARIVVTPALHRRHHTRTRPDLDRNFGTIFICWDRWWHTYLESSSATRIETGLPGGTAVLTLRRALWLPFGRSTEERTHP